MIVVTEEKLHNDAKKEIVNYVKDRFAHAKSAQLNEIQQKFQGQPYNLSEGTVINYLNELVDGRKLSTWKSKNLRYYGPPKIPLPIKFGIAVCTIIIFSGFLIDNFAKSVVDYIYFAPSMLPFIVIAVFFSLLFTLAWYLSQRKVYK